MKVGDIIRQTAARYPDKVGLVYEDQQYNWQEVNSRVNRLAHGLLGLGLRKGDRVAILSRNCNQYLEFYFAAAKAGLISVPLNTWLLPTELSELIHDSGAAGIIVDEIYTEKAEGLDVDSVKHSIGLGQDHPYPHDLEHLIRESSDEEPDVEVEENDIFTLAYTSGTTGRSKGAMVTHKNSCTAVKTMAQEWRFQPHSVYLMHAPMFFAAGGGSRFHAVLRGSRCLIMTYDASKALEIIEKERVTHFSMTPTQIRRIIEHPRVQEYDLSSVCQIGLIGAPHSVAEIKKVEEVFGHVWYCAWGMTETSTCGTVLQPEEVALEGPLSRRLTSVGKAEVGMEVRVVDEKGEAVACDGEQMGEAILRGDAVMKGYWNKPEETAEVLKEGWFYTGDLVALDEEGYLYIVDRKKDIIISGGINISAREVEEVIYTLPAVTHCAVIGVPHKEWGETPKAIVVKKEGMSLTEREIIEHCAKHLASFKKPTSVDFVDNLPMTASGKILKKDLREMYRTVVKQ